MEQELKDDRSPLLENNITVCLPDSSLDRLEKRCAGIEELHDDMNIVIERPLRDQLKLHISLIPSIRILTEDSVMRFTPVTLASGIVGVTRRLRDNRGGYIGSTGKEGKPVYYAPELACLQNMSPATTFFGDLGTSESFDINILIYQMVSYGGYGLIIDPKGERSHWEKQLIVLRGLISVVTLGAATNDRRKLDPYNIYPDDIREAHELTLSIPSDLFGLDPKSDEYIAVLEVQRRMGKSHGTYCMLRLARMLEAVPEEDNLHEAANNLARGIILYRDNGMAGLPIGDGTEHIIALGSRLNIIQLQNLKMLSLETPKWDYTRDEVLSVVIFGAISAFIKRFALMKRPVPKGIPVDGSWVISAPKEGCNMEEPISRVGRSPYTCIIYSGHSMRDLPTGGIKNPITYKLVLRSRGNREGAARLLGYPGLEVAPENMLVIQNLGAGQCLFKDLYNRVGMLQFDPVFQDLFNISFTTPTEDVSEGPEPKAPGPETLEPKAPEPEISKLPEDRIISKPEPLLNFELAESGLFTKEDI